MNIIEVQQASRSLRKQFSKTVEPIHTTKPCVLVEVDTTGSAAVKGRPNYVWAREYAEAGADTGGVFQVLDLTTLPTVNLPVLVGPAPKPPYQTQVLGTNSDMLQQSNAITNPIYGQGRHAKSHVFVRGGLDPQYGTDITFNTEANFGDCICLPTDPPSMQVLVNKGCYIHEGVPKSFSGGLTPNLTSYIPGTGLGRLVYILIDGDTNAIELLSGPTFAYAQPMIDPVTYAATQVTVTIGRVLVGRVILYPGLTAINEAQFRYDIKPLLHTLNNASGGNVATDTIWDAKGDLAVGTGADTAARLPVGGDGDVLVVATDTPAWSAPVDIGTDAANITAIDFTEGTSPAAPGAGYRLIYAKNDGIYEKDSSGTETKFITSSGVYPKRAMMWHSEALVTVGNAIAQSPATSQSYNSVPYQNTAANGDTFTNGCLLESGTYTFRVYAQKGNNEGKVDWYLDDNLIVSGMDLYAAGATYNVIVDTGGINVAAAGWHVVKGVVNGKHASSSNYYVPLTYYSFIPGAD